MSKLRFAVALLLLALSMTGCSEQTKCVVPEFDGSISITGIVNRAHLNISIDESGGIESAFTPYNPMGGGALFTAIGTGVCLNDRLLIDFTEATNQAAELDFAHGSLTFIYDQSENGSHFGRWSTKVEQLEPISSINMVNHLENKKEYIVSSGYWSTIE